MTFGQALIWVKRYRFAVLLGGVSALWPFVFWPLTFTGAYKVNFWQALWAGFPLGFLYAVILVLMNLQRTTSLILMPTLLGVVGFLVGWIIQVLWSAKWFRSAIVIVFLLNWFSCAVTYYLSLKAGG
jgi:hypothetical protein